MSSGLAPGWEAAPWSPPESGAQASACGEDQWSRCPEKGDTCRSHCILNTLLPSLLYFWLRSLPIQESLVLPAPRAAAGIPWGKEMLIGSLHCWLGTPSSRASVFSHLCACSYWGLSLLVSLLVSTLLMGLGHQQVRFQEVFMGREEGAKGGACIPAITCTWGRWWSIFFKCIKIAYNTAALWNSSRESI